MPPSVSIGGQGSREQPIAYDANFIELKVPMEDLNNRPDDAVIRAIYN